MGSWHHDRQTGVAQCTRCGYTQHVGPLLQSDIVHECLTAVDPSECSHRGGQVGARTCESCRGHVRIKLFACAVHGECTTDLRFADVQGCRTCRDFKAPAGPDQPRGEAYRPLPVAAGQVLTSTASHRQP